MLELLVFRDQLEAKVLLDLQACQEVPVHLERLVIQVSQAHLVIQVLQV